MNSGRAQGRVIAITCCILGVLAHVTFAVTTVEFVAFESGSGTPENWNRLFARFMEQNPDIQVQVQLYSWSAYSDAIFTRIASGLAPDLSK